MSFYNGFSWGYGLQGATQSASFYGVQNPTSFSPAPYGRTVSHNNSFYGNLLRTNSFFEDTTHDLTVAPLEDAAAAADARLGSTTSPVAADTDDDDNSISSISDTSYGIHEIMFTDTPKARVRTSPLRPPVTEGDTCSNDTLALQRRNSSGRLLRRKVSFSGVPASLPPEMEPRNATHTPKRRGSRRLRTTSSELEKATDRMLETQQQCVNQLPPPQQPLLQQPPPYLEQQAAHYTAPQQLQTPYMQEQQLPSQYIQRRSLPPLQYVEPLQQQQQQQQPAYYPEQQPLSYLEPETRHSQLSSSQVLEDKLSQKEQLAELPPQQQPHEDVRQPEDESEKTNAGTMPLPLLPSLERLGSSTRGSLGSFSRQNSMGFRFHLSRPPSGLAPCIQSYGVVPYPRLVYPTTFNPYRNVPYGLYNANVVLYPSQGTPNYH